eukprot:scaffold22613_cov40-Tisochrysis_lutea.AAC.1
MGWEGELCQQWAMGVAALFVCAMQHRCSHAPCAQRARIARGTVRVGVQDGVHAPSTFSHALIMMR